MARITNQKEFIDKANLIHNDKYDYSMVEYVKSSVKVKIICPVHGVFEQTPNKHLAGQGCKQCGRDSTKTGRDEFIKRARAVHGDKYDYSEVIYVRKDQKVKIICPIHGIFEQTPHSHVTLKQNCPKCSAIAGGQKRTGDNNSMRKSEVKAKARATCIEKYGAKTFAESDIGRQMLHDIITSDDVQNRSMQTCLSKYGAKNWTQSDIGHKTLHEIMSSTDMISKIKAGYMSAYGIDHYMKTEEGRNIARSNILLPERQIAVRNAFIGKYGVPNALLVPEVREKIKRTNLERYGFEIPSMSSEIQKKIRQTNFEKYGVEYVMQLSEFQKKAWQTKRRNGTFNTSKPEQTLYLLLCDVFGEKNVAKQYSDIRYPFHCDFYIKPLDLFIELNAHWTHGGHWFDENNSFDIDKLISWSSQSRNSQYYQSAIYIWTERDPMKLKCAVDNNLNYLVFWDSDLTDARAWLNQFML